MQKHNRIKMDKMIIVLIVFLFLLSACVQNVQSQENKTFCKSGQRNASVCIEEYKPVCGWFDSNTIKCFKYPCAAKYSNSCFACSDEKVLYYTDGECPK